MLDLARFEGVIGHHFEHSLEGNIIQSLETVEDISEFYSNSKTEIQRYTKYGLPLNTETKESSIAKLESKRLKVYEIYSSYGSSGWIIADDYNVEVNEINQT